jgi:hypothetical protein
MTCDTYNNPIKSEFVEMEDALNAEQALEPAKGMQLCALTTGDSMAKAVKARYVAML